MTSSVAAKRDLPTENLQTLDMRKETAGGDSLQNNNTLLSEPKVKMDSEPVSANMTNLSPGRRARPLKKPKYQQSEVYK